MPTINSSQVAIIYGTTSKILRSKIVPQVNEIVTFAVPAGQNYLIMPRVQPYHDAAARQAIADKHGVAVLDANADRCVAVDGQTGNVKSVVKADPALDSVPGLTLMQSRLADIGDKWNGSTFQRRWVVASSTTGLVLSVVFGPVDSPPAVLASQFAVANLSAQVGDVVPVAKTG